MAANLKNLNPEEMKKLESALQNDDIVDALVAEKDVEGVREVLAANGINFTTEEVELIRDAFAKAKTTEGELSTEDLEDVAGGSFTLFSYTRKTKKGSWTVNIPW